MEGNAALTAKIEQALEKRQGYLENRQLPQLKEYFTLYHASFQSIYNVLLRKGLLQEDPYKHERKISDIEAPDSSHFIESERDEIMSIRLSEFDSQLDFLKSYYQFSLDFLDLDKLKKLAKLTKFIKWDYLSENASGVNTRALGELLSKMNKGADQVSTGIIGDAQNQLTKLSRQILGILKEVSDFHREYYKLEVRKNVISPLEEKNKTIPSNSAEIMKQIKKLFPQYMNGRPFYTELIEEVIAESYSGEAEKLQEELLKKLQVPEQKKNVIQQKVDFKGMLLDALRTLANASRSLDIARQKLYENSSILDNRKMTFMERFRRWIESMFEKGEQKKIYTVEYFDEASSTTKTENIDFNNFMEQIGKKIQLFNGFLSKIGQIYKKIQNAPEEKIFVFLDKNIGEMQLIYRRLNSLDTFFKAEVKREERNKMRGIKIELTAIQNNIINANQKRHEYVARKEEVEQMKKLGIDVEVS